MVYNSQSSFPLSSSTTSQTISQSSSDVPVASPTRSSFSGTDVFYIILAISVLVRVIVSPPDQSQK